MKRLVLLLALFALTVSGTYSQDEDFTYPINFGLYGGASFNMHSPDFYLYDYYDYWIVDDDDHLFDSESFYDNSETSVMPFGGFIFNYQINKTFVFSGRIGYNSMSGTLEPSILLTSDNFGFYEELDANLQYLEVSPYVQFHNLLPVKPLYFLAGIDINVPLTAEYTITATDLLSDPPDPWGEINGDIPDANIMLGIALGAGYVFELGSNVYLTPEASVHLPFTQVSADEEWQDWSIPQVRLGVSLTYGFGTEDEEIVEEPGAAPLEVGFNQLNAYDKQGNRSDANRIHVEEVQYNELFPLVPYVFFAEDSDIPSEESQELAAENPAGEFTMNDLKPDAVMINSRTLDIIGLRMNDNTRANLTITGTHDSKAESGDRELARQRAEFAKNYLVVNYGINANRITAKGEGLPAKPSTSRVPEGVAENRRIELSSNDPNLLMPILLEKETQRLAEPEIIEFVPYAESADSIEYWELEISQTDNVIRRFEGSGSPEAQKWVILPNELEAGEIPVDYAFTAETVKGKREMETGTIPVNYISMMKKQTEERPDKIISKYSLIVFDFDSPVVSEKDKRILDEQVLPAIKFNSTVQIYGYTDMIGNESYNQKLSLQRAENVKKYLESKVKNVKFEVYGVGENVELYNNDLPIGRQLSRTVQVYVITPKQ
ncbi:MAG: OmpA family protein [Candidatus Kapaibacterium sp.]